MMSDRYSASHKLRTHRKSTNARMVPPYRRSPLGSNRGGVLQVGELFHGGEWRDMRLETYEETDLIT